MVMVDFFQILTRRERNQSIRSLHTLRFGINSELNLCFTVDAILKYLTPLLPE